MCSRSQWWKRSPVESEDLHEPPGPQGPAQHEGQVHHAAGHQICRHAVLSAVGHLGPPSGPTHHAALPLLHPARRHGIVRSMSHSEVSSMVAGLLCARGGAADLCVTH